jgi:mono/diheme cytochrome c family protein
MGRVWISLACAFAVVTAGCGKSAPGPAAIVAIAPQTDSDTAPRFADAVLPLVTRHCVACHGKNKSEGGVAFDAYASEPAAMKDIEVWRKAAELLRAGLMPPEGKPRPTTDERDAFNAWVDAAVFRVDCGGPTDPGRVTLRRLNRGEYNRTIRDLIGIDFRPADDFPADDTGYGFDTIGDVLSVPPLLTEKYLAAAEQIIDRAYQSPEARQRLLNPPAEDFVPAGLRDMVIPVREPARKTLRLSAADAPPPPTATDVELDRAYRILRPFADRAYRRPATHEEITRLLRFVESAQRNGDGVDAGLRLALQAILASPHFLFKVELDRGTGNQTLGEFELATRLSYFLWSSCPDEDLFRLAATGQLRRPGVVEGQVRRMMRDPKSRALAEEFAPQWLQTRGMITVAPDPAQFPTFDDDLRRAMLRETELFFDEIVRADHPVTDLLDADFTFINERLARHYGIGGVSGDEFRRVSLAGTNRGGVLTQAAVLTVTSNPTRTSPVKRGRWVLDNLLGTPPPAPPPGVDDLKPATQHGRLATLRERLELHRTQAECAGCHGRMDPLGFALENLDAVGAWRDADEGQPIDPSGKLPDGRSFRGPDGLRTVLRDRAGDFRRCLSEKLMTYALGRGLTPADRCAVDRVVHDLRRGDDRFSSLVLAIVRSEPFQSRGPLRGEP